MMTMFLSGELERSMWKLFGIFFFLLLSLSGGYWFISVIHLAIISIPMLLQQGKEIT